MWNLQVFTIHFIQLMEWNSSLVCGQIVYCCFLNKNFSNQSKCLKWIQTQTQTPTIKIHFKTGSEKKNSWKKFLNHCLFGRNTVFIGFCWIFSPSLIKLENWPTRFLNSMWTFTTNSKWSHNGKYFFKITGTFVMLDWYSISTSFVHHWSHIGAIFR